MSFLEGLSHTMKLTPEERDGLTELLAQQICKVRSSAVVRVFGTEPPYHDQWVKRHFGVAVFVADCYRRSFYIQVYDPPTCYKVFEQELYKEFDYVITSYSFHQFEGDNEMIGLDFVNEEESAIFADQITKHLEKKRLKARNRTQNSETNQQLPENQYPPQNYGETGETAPTESFDYRTTTDHIKKKRKNKIRKSEIGNPENFIHVSHVGYNSDVTSAANSQEAILATILEMSNIKPRELEDEKTKEVFLNFIETNGGIEKVYKKLKAKKITTGTFSQSSISRAFLKKTASIYRPKARLPEEAQHHDGQPASRPPRTNFSVQTPPISEESAYVPEPPSGFAGWNSLVNTGNAPQPPPQHNYQEPPLQQTPKFSPVPQFGVSQTPSSLQAVQQPSHAPANKKGAHLHTQPPVPPPMAKPPPPPMVQPPPPPMVQPPPIPPGGMKHLGPHGNSSLKKQEPQDHQINQQDDTPSRDDLLNQIRSKGFKLKKVEDVDEERVPSSRFENSLIASLAQTLDDRSRACRGASVSDDSDSDVGSGSDSEEWD